MKLTTKIKTLVMALPMGMVYPGSGVFAQAISSAELERVARINLPPVRYLSNSAGERLAYYSFQPRGKARAILLLYHTAGKRVAVHYPILARRLAMDHGMAVYLMDVRGRSHYSHGKPARLAVRHAGRLPGTGRRVWKDAREMMFYLRRMHPGRRIYLAGHGRGAGMILNYSAWKAKRNPDGYIFLAPDLGYRTHVSRPRFPVLEPAGCSGLGGEDYPGHGIRIRSESASIAMVPRRPRAQFRGLNRPAALFIGARDERLRPGKVIAFARLIRTRKVARILPGSGHFSLLLEAAGSVAAFMETDS